MDCQAAVLTGKGTGALATIQLVGNDAARLVKVLAPKAPLPQTGQIRLVTLIHQNTSVDQVTMGCEAPDRVAIHCHGNPLIVERIMELLRQAGAKLVTAEVQQEVLLRQTHNNSIAIEAQQALTVTQTLFGAQLLQHQLEHGLLPLLKQWQQASHHLKLETVQTTCLEILNRYASTQYALHGCTVALIGPPNSGKSTLFNRLVGSDKSIVSNMHGTTRDYIDAELALENLHLRLIDTAGLDPRLAQHHEGHLDQSAQTYAQEQLAKADILLLILDRSVTHQPQENLPWKQFELKPTLTVLNKADLPDQLDRTDLALPTPILHMSAQQDKGWEQLILALHQLSGITDLDSQAPTAFTSRQHNLLVKLSQTSPSEKAQSLIQELLNGI